MELSIFDKVGLPLDSDHKKSLSWYASKPNLPKVVSCGSTEELINTVTKSGWSPFVYNGYRNQSNFMKTNFLVLDIDNGLTLSEAEKRVEQLDSYCLCLPTSSHTDKLHKFRLIFVTSITIRDIDTYKHNMKKLVEIFPESDPSCITDIARFYFPCKQVSLGFVHKAGLYNIEVVKKTVKEPKTSNKVYVNVDIDNLVERLYGSKRTTVPECVNKMLTQGHTGLDGEWILTLNSFVFTLSMTGIDYETIYGIIEQIAPYELSNRDVDCMERAYSDGEKERDTDE